MRELMAETQVPASRERLTFEEVGQRYVRHLEEVMQRKPTTIQDYRIMLGRHLGRTSARPRSRRITPHKVAEYIAPSGEKVSRTDDQQPAQLPPRRVQVRDPPRVGATEPRRDDDRPPSPPTDPDIRFLDREELEALLRAALDDLLGPTDRVLWLTAAMTGLRQGELAALRWRDVDWTARLVRVRRSYSRGQWTTPKSRRSRRAVPMADRVAGELERHFQAVGVPHDDDLVFCHPQTGRPYDASKMRERFKAALARAGLRELRFHDLRHTYGTLMAAAGTPLRTLQGWMGHRDYKTTEIYADFAPDPSQGPRGRSGRSALRQRRKTPLSGAGCSKTPRGVDAATRDRAVDRFR